MTLTKGSPTEFHPQNLPDAAGVLGPLTQLPDSPVGAAGEKGAAQMRSGPARKVEQRARQGFGICLEQRLALPTAITPAQQSPARRPFRRNLVQDQRIRSGPLAISGAAYSPQLLHPGDGVRSCGCDLGDAVL